MRRAEDWKVFVISKPFDPDCHIAFIRILQYLEESKIEAYVQEEERKVLESEFHPDSERSTEVESLDLSKLQTFTYGIHTINLIITIGGDGTILYASKIFAFSECPPVISFSMGSLGYLANFPVNDYVDVLNKCLKFTSVEDDTDTSAGDSTHPILM